MNIFFRDSRNRTVDHLFRFPAGSNEAVFTIGLTPPLTDLPVYAATKRVAYQKQATIVVEHSQLGVSYKLCNDDQSPVVEALPQMGTGGSIRLVSDAITEDRSFLVQASKTVGGRSIQVLMNSAVRVRVGLDLDIPLTAVQEEIDYDQFFTVILGNTEPGASDGFTQAGVLYQLFDGADQPLSDPSQGLEGQVITIASTERLQEDTEVFVKAKRVDTDEPLERLNNSVTIRVRANPGLSVSVPPASQVVDYGAAGMIEIADSQASVTYRLYSFPAEELMYWQNRSGQLPAQLIDIPIDLPNPLPADLPNQPVVRLAHPPISEQGVIPAWYQQLSGSDTRGNGGVISLATPNLEADQVCVVLALKAGHQQPEVLRQAAAILVRPNAEVQLSARAATVDSGSEGEVLLNNSQPGVKYYLRRHEDNSLVPGARQMRPKTSAQVQGSEVQHGLDRMKVGVDLLVGPPAADPLSLPTGPLTSSTTFDVLAVNAQTLVWTQLASTLTIEVSAT